MGDSIFCQLLEWCVKICKCLFLKLFLEKWCDYRAELKKGVFTCFVGNLFINLFIFYNEVHVIPFHNCKIY